MKNKTYRTVSANDFITLSLAYGVRCHVNQRGNFNHLGNLKENFVIVNFLFEMRIISEGKTDGKVEIEVAAKVGMNYRVMAASIGVCRMHGLHAAVET